MTNPDDGKVFIAVNVMRARLTVVGFNLAIIGLQLNRIETMPGGVDLPAFDHPVHLEFSVALLMGMGLSILSMVCFIVSSTFNRDGGSGGHCDHWSLLAGDIFMYVALAATVAGFFGPLLRTVDFLEPGFAGQTAELDTLRIALAMVGGTAWLSAMYLGPVVSLLRSPFGRRATAALGVGYLLLVLSTAYVSAEALRIERAYATEGLKSSPTLINELIQPLRW